MSLNGESVKISLLQSKMRATERTIRIESISSFKSLLYGNSSAKELISVPAKAIVILNTL